jgi:DNA polymerase
MSLEDGTIEINGVTYDIVTLDFETFYSTEYTLAGSMNTSEYIRDSRFHAHGVGIKVRNQEALWYTRENIRSAFEEIDWTKSAMLAHNLPFDGFICTQRFDIKPAFYLDTLSMARAAHGHHMRHDLDTVAKAHGLAGKTKRDALADTKGKELLSPEEEAALGEYCLDDVNDTYEIFWKLYDSIPDDELRLIHLTCRMFCEPVLQIDIPRVQEELEKEIGSKAAALLLAGTKPEELLSNNKFAAALKALGVEPPTKISVSTGKETYAFAKSDLEFKRLLAHPDPKVAALADARIKIKSTIGETRAARFLEAGRDGMALPVLLNYSGAHTHRWTGGNKMNLQNLKRGGELRRSILAPAGYVIVVADAEQIEARVLAWLARQMDILQTFAAKKCVYKLMASAIYNIPIEQINEDQRFLGKVCVLGLGYGMGANKLQLTLAQGALGRPPVKLSLEECERIVHIYRTKNSFIRQFWKTMDGVIAGMLVGGTGTIGPITYGKGFMQLPNGLFLQYYGLQGDVQVYKDQLIAQDATYLTRRGRAKLYGGAATENVTQALSRVIIGNNKLAIDDLGYRVVTSTHDEIVAICRKEEAEKCYADMVRIMSTPPDWAPDLPLAAKGGWDINYSK